MTIERIKGLRTAYCDTCDEFAEDDCGVSFQSFLSNLQAEGWTLGRRRGEWEHYCKNCSQRTLSHTAIGDL